MKRFCLLGWCAALIAAVVSPRPSLSWSIGALLLLGFTLALIVLFVGFLGRRIGRRRRGVRWVLLTIVILLPTAVLGLHRLNPPDDKARIKRTIEAIATSGDPAYCGTEMTTAYLEQTTGTRPPFADDVCRNAAGVFPADSVSVSEVAISGDRATALVANRGGSFDGSNLLVRLHDDGGWKLDRLVAFEKFDRRRFNRAYRGLLLASGASPSAAACALRKTGSLSNPELEHVLLHEESRVFVPIGVACDRPGTERRTVQAMANPRTGFPSAVVECAAAKLRSSSDTKLVRLQQSLVAYNELILSCDPEALVDFQQRQLSRNDTLSAEAVACALAIFRRLPPVKAIRLTYDEVRYERLIERCKR